MKKKAAIPVILAALIAAAAVLGYSMRIDTIVYTGNTQYDESWLTRTIFGGLPNRLTYYLFHRSHVSIPEVEKYDVRFSGNEADVQIYEKTRVGYIRICISTGMAQLSKARIRRMKTFRRSRGFHLIL